MFNIHLHNNIYPFAHLMFVSLKFVLSKILTYLACCTSKIYKLSCFISKLQVGQNYFSVLPKRTVNLGPIVYQCQSQDCVQLFAISWTVYSPPGSSVSGSLQARILEWVAIPFCWGSSYPRDGSWVSCSVLGKPPQRIIMVKMRPRRWPLSPVHMYCLLQASASQFMMNFYQSEVKGERSKKNKAHLFFCKAKFT